MVCCGSFGFYSVSLYSASSLDKFGANIYADSLLQPDDLLARIPGEDDDPAILDQWVFYNPQARVQVERLIETTTDSPASVGELRQEGDR